MAKMNQQFIADQAVDSAGSSATSLFESEQRFAEGLLTAIAMISSSLELELPTAYSDKRKTRGWSHG